MSNAPKKKPRTAPAMDADEGKRIRLRLDCVVIYDRALRGIPEELQHLPVAKVIAAGLSALGVGRYGAVRVEHGQREIEWLPPKKRVRRG